MCLEMFDLTSPIVSSSAPEGIFPMEIHQGSSVCIFNLIKFSLISTDNGREREDSASPQMLLVCSWRTIKEISLLFSHLAQIGIQFIRNANEYRFISLEQVVTSNFHISTICFLLRFKLCAII